MTEAVSSTIKLSTVSDKEALDIPRELLTKGDRVFFYTEKKDDKIGFTHDRKIR